MKINWNKVWEDFEEWIQKRDRTKKCPTCHKTDFNFPDWEDQQKAIQKIVNKQLKVK